MADQQSVCIIGGGATGAALLWCLAQDPDARQQWQITLLHDGAALGGHSMTKPVPWNGTTYYVDIGVQLISPMLYPNVSVMLERPEFKRLVPVVDYDTLQIACAFPRDQKGNPQNWGNFQAYQKGANFALYTEQMLADAQLFQDFIEVALEVGWGGKTLAEFFTNPPVKFQNQSQFVDFFLWPYLSIINGYGAALMDQMTFGDLIPIFATIPLLKTPLGSFTNPGVGWQRFAKGASSWVQAMAQVAQGYTKANIYTNCTATAVWTDQNHTPWVQWQDGSGKTLPPQSFTKVVLTTDMWTNGRLLYNTNNTNYWTTLYQKYIGLGPPPGQPPPKDVVWPLQWGMCYIHSDDTMLSPDLRDPNAYQQETLQFTAAYAPSSTYPYYDLTKTYTTYIQKNLLKQPGAAGLYVTMYGYIPGQGDKVPDPSKVIYSQPWTHGMWSASYMSGPKQLLHMAQGLGSVAYPGQQNTNVYFAGNNASTDSEEGALDSAMIIANYAFNVPYPMGLHPLAFAMYYIYYREVMFPGSTASMQLAHVHKLVRP